MSRTSLRWLSCPQRRHSPWFGAVGQAGLCSRLAANAPLVLADRGPRTLHVQHSTSALALGLLGFDQLKAAPPQGDGDPRALWRQRFDYGFSLALTSTTALSPGTQGSGAAAPGLLTSGLCVLVAGEGSLARRTRPLTMAETAWRGMWFEVEWSVSQGP